MSGVGWWRSWPATIPPGRAYVHDGLPRLVMTGHDYNTVAAWPDDEPGFGMLEWDIALDGRQRDQFAEHALACPDEVLVAPYWKKFGSVWQQLQRHRSGSAAVPGARADLFGFGCIYLPQKVLHGWWAYNDSARVRFTDSDFSAWHCTVYGPVAVDWSVHPQHLHGD